MAGRLGDSKRQLKQNIPVTEDFTDVLDNNQIDKMLRPEQTLVCVEFGVISPRGRLES